MMYTSAAQATSGCSCVLPMRSENWGVPGGLLLQPVTEDMVPCSGTTKSVNTDQKQLSHGKFDSIGNLQESI